jgi:oligosaccharide reducing-end xylanase
MQRYLLLVLAVSVVLTACAAPTPAATSTAQPTAAPTATVPAPTPEPTPTPIVLGAVETGQYRNVFSEYLGKSDAEVQEKIDTAWEQLFYGHDDFQRVYYPVGDDMAYMMDIGNADIRSEGMSYGMMIAVQLDKQEEFNRIWKWTKTYMYQVDGPYQGYFAWHATPEGEKLDANPASDGEEWFVMALMFASARWGDGEGIFDYQSEANAILHTMLHKEDGPGGLGTNMFNLEHKQVVFVPRLGSDSSFSDPSYHLPAYYELWARWAKEDNEFWAEAAQVSREYFKKAAHPETGLMPDYANFDGTPYGTSDHKDFRFDAWRTLANVAFDYSWFAADPWQVEQSNRVLKFLASEGSGVYGNQYALDGTPLAGDHSTGLVAMAAVAALAADPEVGTPHVQALWDTEIPEGRWRYYDGLLYTIALLHVSGQFQIYTPNLP